MTTFASPTQDTALSLTQVSKNFGALAAVAGVSLKTNRSERRAVLGSNGAGKTTLFNLITGDIPVSSGKIFLFGEDVTALSVRARVQKGLRRTYQISQLFENLSVRENVYLACRGAAGAKVSLKKPHADDAFLAEADALIARVHLSSVRDLIVGALGHGQQRQLELAMALAGTPRLILFDEPAAGLSPGERGDLIALLEGLPPEIGFIIIEHDMDVALRVADRVTMMHNGRIFKEGLPHEIENDDEVQALYLGDAHV